MFYLFQFPLALLARSLFCKLWIVAGSIQISIVLIRTLILVSAQYQYLQYCTVKWSVKKVY